MYTFIFPLMAAPQSGQEGGSSSLLMSFLPFILIIGIFYFLIIRPQNKKRKETEKMLSALKKGDKVVTIGGLHGIVQNVKETTVIIKVDDNVKLEFLRSAVSSVTAASKDEKIDDKSEDQSSGKA
ncbi:MAG: preprotein translocase subunit YajC [Treponema sp.]|jgi:preprotein translocase subunit YajC|nr:preprotein translocase subunit YajC [Treponema sp.]